MSEFKFIVVNLLSLREIEPRCCPDALENLLLNFDLMALFGTGTFYHGGVCGLRSPIFAYGHGMFSFIPKNSVANFYRTLMHFSQPYYVTALTFAS